MSVIDLKNFQRDWFWFKNFYNASGYKKSSLFEGKYLPKSATYTLPIYSSEKTKSIFNLQYPHPKDNVCSSE